MDSKMPTGRHVTGGGLRGGCSIRAAGRCDRVWGRVDAPGLVAPGRRAGRGALAVGGSAGFVEWWWGAVEDGVDGGVAVLEVPGFGVLGDEVEVGVEVDVLFVRP